ncbi:transposase [Sporomusa malonica]|nr:transposase [Sporomusa malonica]
MLRGINKQNVFEEDADRQRFLETLGYYKAISGYRLYGYCLMNNHIHLLIGETGASISQVIKDGELVMQASQLLGNKANFLS